MLTVKFILEHAILFLFNIIFDRPREPGLSYKQRYTSVTDPFPKNRKKKQKKTSSLPNCTSKGPDILRECSPPTPPPNARRPEDHLYKQD